MPKTHGCSRPPHTFQICSYLIVISLTIAFYVLIVTMLPSPLSTLALVLYTPCLLGLLIFGLLATLSDPTDPVVTAERRAKAEDLPFDTKAYTQICTICKTHVLALSKHCGQCDRCVDGFDHHCKWLNNCIGKRNYHYFAVLIAFLEAVAAVQIGFSAVIIDQMFSQEFAGKVETLVGRERYIYVTLVLIQFGVVVSLFVVVGQLIILHIWLRTHGLTTYDYIMQRRQIKKSQVVAEEKEEDEPAQDQDVTTFHENSVSPDNEGSSAAGSKPRLVLDKYIEYKRVLRVSRDQNSLEDEEQAKGETDQHVKAYYTRKYRKREVVPEANPSDSQDASI